MNLRDSTHLTTHELQLRAYRTYEVPLQSLPSRLADPNSLLEVADKLLHLPETFPAAYLQIYEPIIPICLKHSGALQYLDLETMLGSNAPQLDRTSLMESIVGYGFLATAQCIADLFFAVADIPSVGNARFPAMLCYSDPDYWMGALLLAFEAHQKGSPGRAAGLPIVLGFPETEKRITNLQVNVPPAAIVALLAGRAYRTPTCPHTVYERDQDGLPVIQGLVDESRLCAWVASARRASIEAARKEQTPAINAFVRVNLEGSHALGQRQYSVFQPNAPSVPTCTVDLPQEGISPWPFFQVLGPCCICLVKASGKVAGVKSVDGIALRPQVFFSSNSVTKW